MPSDTDATAPSPHVDQTPPFEWHAVDHDGQTLVVRDVPEGAAECYVATGASRNPRILATDDAAIYGGNVVDVYFDAETRCVDFVHCYAGTMDTLVVTNWLDEPAVRLRKLRSGSGDLAGVIADAG